MAATDKNILYSKESKLGLTTFTFRSKRYSFPSVIVKDDFQTEHGICVMLDVGLFCPFCSGDTSSKYTQKRSRIAIGSKVQRCTTDCDRGNKEIISNTWETKTGLVDKSTLNKPDLSALDSIALQTSPVDNTSVQSHQITATPQRSLFNLKPVEYRKTLLKPDIKVAKPAQGYVDTKINTHDSVQSFSGKRSPQFSNKKCDVIKKEIFQEHMIEREIQILENVIKRETQMQENVIKSEKQSSENVKHTNLYFPSLKDLAFNVLSVSQRRALYEQKDSNQNKTSDITFRRRKEQRGRNIIKRSNEDKKENEVKYIEDLFSSPSTKGRLNSNENTLLNTKTQETNIEEKTFNANEKRLDIISPTYKNKLNTPSNSVIKEQDHFEPVNLIYNKETNVTKYNPKSVEYTHIDKNDSSENITSREKNLTNNGNSTNVKTPVPCMVVENDYKYKSEVENCRNSGDTLHNGVKLGNNNNKDILSTQKYFQDSLSVDFENDIGNNEIIQENEKHKSYSSVDYSKIIYNESIALNNNIKQTLTPRTPLPPSHVDMDKQQHIYINTNNESFTTNVALNENKHNRSSLIERNNGNNSITTSSPSYHKSDDKLWGFSSGGGCGSDRESLSSKKSDENLLVENSGSFSNAGSESYLMEELLSDDVILDDTSGADDNEDSSDQYKDVDEETLRAIERKLLQNLAAIEAQEKHDTNSKQVKLNVDKECSDTLNSNEKPSTIKETTIDVQDGSKNSSINDKYNKIYTVDNSQFRNDVNHDKNSNTCNQVKHKDVNSNSTFQQHGYQYISKSGDEHDFFVDLGTSTTSHDSDIFPNQGIFNIKNGCGKFSVIKKKDKTKTILGLQPREVSSRSSIGDSSDNLVSNKAVDSSSFDRINNASDMDNFKHHHQHTGQDCCRDSPESVMEEILDSMNDETVETFSGDATLGRVFAVSREKHYMSVSSGKSDVESLSPRSPLDEATSDIGEFYNFMKLMPENEGGGDGNNVKEKSNELSVDNNNSKMNGSIQERKKMFTVGGDGCRVSSEMLNDNISPTEHKIQVEYPILEKPEMKTEDSFGSLNDLLDEEITCANDLNETFSGFDLAFGSTTSEQFSSNLTSLPENEENHTGYDSVFNSSADVLEEKQQPQNQNKININEIFEEAFEHALEDMDGNVEEDDYLVKDWTSDYGSDNRRSNDNSKTTSLEKTYIKDTDSYTQYLNSIKIQNSENKRTSSVDCTVGERADSRLSEVASVHNRTPSCGSYSKESVSSFTNSEDETDNAQTSINIPFQQFILDTDKLTKELHQNNIESHKRLPNGQNNLNMQSKTHKIKHDELNVEISHSKKTIQHEGLFHPPQSICPPKSPTIVQRPQIHTAKTQKIQLLTSPQSNRSKRQRHESDLSETDNVDVTREDLDDPMFKQFIQETFPERGFDSHEAIDSNIDFKRHVSVDERSQTSNLSSIDEFIPETEEYNAPPEIYEKAYKAAVQMAQMFQHHHVTHPCFQKIIEEISSSHESLNDTSRSNTLKRNKLLANSENTIPEYEESVNDNPNDKIVIDLYDKNDKSSKRASANFDENIVVSQEEANKFIQHVINTKHDEHNKENKKELVTKDGSEVECHSCVLKNEENVIVKSEEISTQEVTLVFAWPKSMGNPLKAMDQPFRQLQMHRVMKNSDMNVEIIEGPTLKCIERSPDLAQKSILVNDGEKAIEISDKERSKKKKVPTATLR